MTLYDLRGKELFVGDQPVSKLYLGADDLMSFGGGGGPVDYTNSELALAVHNGEVYHYASSSSVIYGYGNEGRKVESLFPNPISSTSIEDDHFHLQNGSGIGVNVEGRWPQDQYYEITFEMTSNVARYNTFIQTPYSLKVDMVYDDTMRVEGAYGQGLFRNAITIPRPANGLHILSVSSVGGYGYVVLDGEIIAEGTGYLYRASQDVGLVTYGTGLYYRESFSSGTKPYINVYDLKFSRNNLTIDQILENHEHIAQLYGIN